VPGIVRFGGVGGFAKERRGLTDRRRNDEISPTVPGIVRLGGTGGLAKERRGLTDGRRDDKISTNWKCWDQCKFSFQRGMV
jgi:hypothetical protein